MKSVAVNQCLHIFRHCFHIDHGPAVHAQNDIFGSRKNLNQFEMLVDHSDSQGIGVLRRTDDNFPSIYKNLTLVREIDAGEHIHQRGFSAAVFAEQRQNFTLFQRKRNVFIGGDFAEVLAYSPQLNCIFSHTQSSFL